jgi:phosphorylcholine metabolism protein LicD
MNTTGHTAGRPSGRRKHIDWAGRTVRLELFIVLVGTALLLAALSLWLATGNFNSTESKQLETSRYQAVFLTNNQVYFGKVTSLNDKSVVLTDVFYIETPNNSQNSASTTNTNYTLRKLGDSELHAPEDKMVISRSQVIFWENLKDSSQVVTKIKEYKKNPSAAQQNSSSNQNTSNTQNQNPANSSSQQNNSQTNP